MNKFQNIKNHGLTIESFEKGQYPSTYWEQYVKADVVETILGLLTTKYCAREWMLRSDNFGKLTVYSGPDLAPGEVVTIREVIK